MATSYRHDEETNETANSYDWLLHDYGHDAMNQTPAWRIEYNRNRLHDLFAHDTWANLDFDTKKNALQALENDFAFQQHRPPVKVEVSHLRDTVYGGWNEDRGSIVINENLLTNGTLFSNPKHGPMADINMQLFDTVAHEGYHAYQTYARNIPGFHEDAEQVARWSQNEGHYFESWPHYAIQPLESDAWAFGHEATTRAFPGIEDRNGSEPWLAKTMYEHRSRVNSYDRALRKAEQQDPNVLERMDYTMKRGCEARGIKYDAETGKYTSSQSSHRLLDPNWLSRPENQHQQGHDHNTQGESPIQEPDYQAMAEKIPFVQNRLSKGADLADLEKDPNLGACARTYFDPDNMIKVTRRPEGGFACSDDDWARIEGAQKAGYEIPVHVTNAADYGPVDDRLRLSISERGDRHRDSSQERETDTESRTATDERQLGDDRHVPASVDGQSHTTEHADSQTTENEAQPAVEREHDREMSDRDESRNDVAGDRVDSEQEERRGNRTEDPERERPQAAEQTETSENKVAAETHRAAGHEETTEQKSSERIRLVDRTGQDETPEIDGESQTGERDHDRTDEPGQNTAERFDKSNDESNAASNVRTQTIEQDDSPTVEHETDRQQAYGDDGVAPEAEDRSQTTEHVTQAEQTLDGAAEEEAAAQTVDDGETVTEGMTDDHDQTVEASQNEIVEPDGLGADDHTVNDSLDQDEAHGQDAALDEEAERGENIFQDEQLARTADLDRDENQSQGEVRSQDENLSMDEDLSRDDDLSMDQMTGQSSAYDQSQDETQNESQSESQDEDLSMDDLSAEPGQVEQDEQAVQTEQASQNEQVQDEDPSMGRMTGRSVDDEQEQTDDLSMDQMTTATPRGEQSQDDEYDLSDMTRQDAGEQQDGMEESDHTEDFSMDDMTDASATNDEQNSADEEESIMPPSDSGSSDSGESEDEDNSYHY